MHDVQKLKILLLCNCETTAKCGKQYWKLSLLKTEGTYPLWHLYTFSPPCPWYFYFRLIIVSSSNFWTLKTGKVISDLDVYGRYLRTVPGPWDTVTIFPIHWLWYLWTTFICRLVQVNLSMSKRRQQTSTKNYIRRKMVNCVIFKDYLFVLNVYKVDYRDCR